MKAYSFALRINYVSTGVDMINTTIKVLGLGLILNGLMPAAVMAMEAGFFQGYGHTQDNLNLGFAENLNSKTFSVKRGEIYDEAKDPALRKGTENWEQEQGSFFAIPALVLGVIGIVLFFNRK